MLLNLFERIKSNFENDENEPMVKENEGTKWIKKYLVGGITKDDLDS